MSNIHYYNYNMIYFHTNNKLIEIQVFIDRLNHPIISVSGEAQHLALFLFSKHLL